MTTQVISIRISDELRFQLDEQASRAGKKIAPFLADLIEARSDLEDFKYTVALLVREIVVEREDRQLEREIYNASAASMEGKMNLLLATFRR